MRTPKEINKMSLSKNCCICQAPITKEDAPVIAMSAYGNPKCVCEKCEAIIDSATLSHDPNEIVESCQLLGEALTRGNTCDEQVIDAVNGIISEASIRCEKIANGNYDFSEDEKEGEEFEITEDIMESEEDRIKDEKDQKVAKIVDTIGSWVSGVVLLGAVIFFIIKFIL